MSEAKINETLQDFVLQGFCVSRLSLDDVIDFEQVEKRDVVGIAPPVMPAPSVANLFFSIGRLEQDFIFNEVGAGGLNIAFDAVDFYFAADAPIIGDDSPVFAAGFDAAAFGLPKTWLWNTPVWASGFDAALWGKAKLINRNQVLLPRSWDSLTLGRDAIWNVSQSLVPKGLDATQWGNLNVSPRFVYVRGLDSAVFGRGVLFNANQFVAAIGLNATAWGNTRLMVLRQLLSVRGFDANKVGNGRVSERVRATLPLGFDASEFGVAFLGGGVREIAPSSLPFMVGYTRQLGNVSGWADGEQNIPVSKSLNETYSVWSYGWLGIAAVENVNRVIQPNGIDALNVPSHYLAGFTQSIETMGSDELSMGFVYRYNNEQLPRTWKNPAFSTWQQSYWEDEKNNWIVGLTVLFAKRPVFTKGFDAAQGGYALIAFDTRTIAPYGWDSAANIQYTRTEITHNLRRLTNATAGFNTVFGRTVVVNKHTKIIAAKGVLFSEWGNAFVQNRRIVALGFDNLLLGKTALHGGLFQGFDGLNIGNTTVSLYRNAVSVSGVDLSAVGLPQLRSLIIYPDAIVNHAGVFGDVLIGNKNRCIWVKSLDDARHFSSWTRIELRDARLQLGLGSQFEAGFPTIENWERSVYPQGIEWARFSFGYPWLSERVRYLSASMGIQSVFGRHEVSKTPLLIPLGKDSSIFGNTEFLNLNQYIKTGNLYAPPFGLPVVDFFTRKIDLNDNGILSNEYGVAWVSHYRRMLGVVSADSLIVNRHARVSFGLNAVAPLGIAPPDFRQPKLGYTRYIAPDSWDSSGFLTRIIPEWQGVSFLPDAAIQSLIFGSANVFNRLQVIEAIGLSTQDGFGFSAVWNKRQYIYPVHDDLGGTVPLEWTGLAAVFNRNRVVDVLGVAPLGIYEPLIYLAARVSSPVGLDGLGVGLSMVAFKVRDVLPETWDSLTMTGWGTVYNSARVVAPFAWFDETLGLPEILNTRRNYRWITAGEQAQYGLPMVDFAVRTLAPYQGIKPDYIPLPDVQLATRYVQIKGVDMAWFGATDVQIRWNKIAPKFAYRELFGWANVWNVTPELHFKGVDMADLGMADIQLLTRYITPETGLFTVFGNPYIGDSRRYVVFNGIATLNFGKHHVWHLTTPVNYSRVIYPINADYVPELYIGNHLVRDNVLRPSGIGGRSLVSDKHYVWSNTVRVDIGIGIKDGFGLPVVELKHRTISLNEHGIDASITCGKPIMSPLTIWARHDAPSQARSNHGSSYWRDIDAWKWVSGNRIGYPVVTQPHDTAIKQRGFNALNVGVHHIELLRRVIFVQSFNPFRMGWVVVGNDTQEIIQFKSPDFSLIGTHNVAFPKDSKQFIKASGINAFKAGRAWVSLFRQPVYPKHWDSQLFGFSRNLENGYMPQSLCVYFPKPVLPEMWDSVSFGDAHISLFNRYVLPETWDSLVSEYDLMNFKARMRVRRGGKTVQVQVVQVYGFDVFDAGVSDVSHKVRFIRPDGFMDNYRKGVANV